jgi:hypothetical protein
MPTTYWRGAPETDVVDEQVRAMVLLLCRVVKDHPKWAAASDPPKPTRV